MSRKSDTIRKCSVLGLVEEVWIKPEPIEPIDECGGFTTENGIKTEAAEIDTAEIDPFILTNTFSIHTDVIQDENEPEPVIQEIYEQEPVIIKSEFGSDDDELTENTASPIYDCKECGKVFSSKSSLTRHLKMHSG